MLKDIVFASPLGGHRLRVRYEGVVDLGAIVSFRGVFAWRGSRSRWSILNSGSSRGQMSSTDVWFRTVMNWWIPEVQNCVPPPSWAVVELPAVFDSFRGYQGGAARIMAHNQY